MSAAVADFLSFGCMLREINSTIIAKVDVALFDLESMRLYIPP